MAQSLFFHTFLSFTHDDMFCHLHIIQCFITFIVSSYIICQSEFLFFLKLPITSCSVSFIHSKVCISRLLCWVLCHSLEVQCWTRQTRGSCLHGARVWDQEIGSKHTRSSAVSIAASEEVEPGWGKCEQKSLSQEVTFELRLEWWEVTPVEIGGSPF